METKNREKLLLMATGVVVGLWLLNLLVVSPLIDSWHSRSAEIAKLKEQIANGAGMVRRESIIRDRWDYMRGNALPNNATVAERQLFTAFDHWVTSAGVAEGSFRPQVQEGDSNFTTVDCRSDVSGSLRNISDFVRAMSKDPLADKVDSFELTSKDDNGQQLTLGLSMSGLILTDSDPSSVAPVPKPEDPAASENTNSPSTTEKDPFRLIARNNIFNQSRRFNDSDSRPRARTPVVQTLTAHGTGHDHGVGSANFEGTGVDASKFYDVGSSVGPFKLANVAGETVTLTDASNTFVLPADGSASLRREDDGPWRRSSYAAAVPAPETNTNATASNSAASAAGSAADDIIARLKKRREQE
jgi:hypothetical protein